MPHQMVKYNFPLYYTSSPYIVDAGPCPGVYLNYESYKYHCARNGIDLDKYMEDLFNIMTIDKNKVKYSGYEELERVLNEALDQAAIGKGKERHANDKPFIEQKIITGQKVYGMGSALFQASKKMEEAFRMENWQSARRDLLGAIVYTAAAIIHGDMKEKDV